MVGSRSTISLTTNATVPHAGRRPQDEDQGPFLHAEHRHQGAVNHDLVMLSARCVDCSH
jgi:hypothetical protein